MKNITKKKIVLVTLSFILGFSIPIFTNYQGNLKAENQPTLKTPNLKSQRTEFYTIAQISDHLWSPDGTKVAYIKSPSGEMWNCELWVADKNPLDAELINHLLISSEAEYNGLLDWKGDWILFRIRREEGEPASYYGRNELWRIKADGTGLSQVTFTYTNGIKYTENGFYINRGSAGWGRFIPGTDLVYFHAHYGNGWPRTFVCNANGTDNWYDISNPDYTWRPALSPTGNKLLWGQQSDFGQPTTHKSCNVDGSGRTTIKAFTNVISVTVLADGNTVIWSNNDNIYAIDMDGTNERTVLDDVYINRQWNYNPSDVQGLIMGSDRSDGNMHIYKINIDGTGIEQLTEGPYLDEFPILSPDGQYLSYLRLPFDFDKGSSTLPYPYELIVKSLYPVSQLKNYNMDPGYPYSWIDASGGTELFLGDDDYAAIALPFAFTFYDQTFSTIYLCSNGYLSFTDTIPFQNVNVPFPSADPWHNYMIAPFWDDLRPAAGGGSGNIYVQSFGTYWVAEWANIWHYSSGPTVGSFEVVLKNTGEIIFNYDYISYSGGGYTCGLNLGVDTDYYNSYQGLDDLTDDFSILFTYESFDHELSVSLDTPVNPEIGNSYLINATVNNYGLNEELDVDLLLYLDDVIVESTTISSLPVGASETISYMWIPPDYGAYNFTGYAPPVTDETFAGNNFITKIIQIVDSQLFDGMYIAHDFTDLGSSTNPSNILYTYNTDEFFNVAWDFTVNGDNWQVNSITREITGSYFFTDFTHTPMWIFPSVSLGDTVLISSIWDVDHTFEVRDELIYDLLDFGLIEIWVLQDLGDPSATAWYEKSTGILLNGTFYYTGGNNYVIFEFVDTNVQFSYITPDHDLSVSLEVPSSPDVGDIYIVNATVFNNGNNDEFNVDLFLYLDDVIVDSITISSLPIGASETINYMWIPPDYGIYNFTAHAPPVPDEPFITNNINTKLVSIFSPSKNYTMTAGVPYVWINASGGTELFLSDDGFATVDLPFDFTFYDQTFSTIYLGSNGYLSFTDSTPNDYTNDPIPSGDVDNYYLIAPFWDDLYPPSGGNVFVQSFDTYWVAAWVDIYHINGLVLGSFEVVFSIQVKFCLITIILTTLLLVIHAV